MDAGLRRAEALIAAHTPGAQRHRRRRHRQTGCRLVVGYPTDDLGAVTGASWEIPAALPSLATLMTGRCSRPTPRRQHSTPRRRRIPRRRRKATRRPWRRQATSTVLLPATHRRRRRTRRRRRPTPRRRTRRRHRPMRRRRRPQRATAMRRRPCSRTRPRRRATIAMTGQGSAAEPTQATYSLLIPAREQGNPRAAKGQTTGTHRDHATLHARSLKDPRLDPR